MTVTSGRAPGAARRRAVAAIDRAVLLQFLQQGFERNAILAAQVKGPRDLALADRHRRSADELKDLFLAGQGTALPLPAASAVSRRAARASLRGPRDGFVYPGGRSWKIRPRIYRRIYGAVLNSISTKGVLVIVGVDDVVFDADRAVIGLHRRPSRRCVVPCRRRSAACRPAKVPRHSRSHGGARSFRRPAQSAIRSR